MECSMPFKTFIKQSTFLFCEAFPFHHLIFEVGEIFLFAGCNRGSSLSCNILAGACSINFILFIIFNCSSVCV